MTSRISPARSRTPTTISRSSDGKGLSQSGRAMRGRFCIWQLRLSDLPSAAPVQLLTRAARASIHSVKIGSTRDRQFPEGIL